VGEGVQATGGWRGEGEGPNSGTPTQGGGAVICGERAHPRLHRAAADSRRAHSAAQRAWRQRGHGVRGGEAVCRSGAERSGGGGGGGAAEGGRIIIRSPRRRRPAGRGRWIPSGGPRRRGGPRGTPTGRRGPASCPLPQRCVKFQRVRAQHTARPAAWGWGNPPPPPN